MRGFLRGALALPALAVVLAAGCNRPPASAPAPANRPSGPPMITGRGPGPAEAGGGSSPIRDIMEKLAKGPGSLNGQLGSELKADPPPWETIQPQAKEFAKLAGELGKYDPPKGSKESWTKLTAAYAQSAEALDKAAEAKDRGAAVAAHDKLASSCMECHREHRVMRGMRP